MVKQLSGNYGMNKMDLMESLNRQISGWAAFYQYTDYTATLFNKLDRTVFWKFGHWLARKYRRGFRSLMRDFVRAPAPEQATGLVWGGVATAARDQSKRSFHMANAIRKSIHHARRETMHHRIALCRCRLCHEQHLNGEPDALRGASPVRRGETGR